MRDFKIYQSSIVNKSQENATPMLIRDLRPMLFESVKETSFDKHYVYHIAWAARKLAEFRPIKHLDIGSHHYFSTIASAFIPVKYLEYRPVSIELSNLEVGKADLTQLNVPNQSIDSLSCMHVVEHIGLGRYGDLIDPDGDIQAMKELSRVIAPGGLLLFVVPVGKPKVYFNAHRVYDPSHINKFFLKQGFSLNEFAIITDKGKFLRFQQPEKYTDQKYACGCYALFKRGEG